MSFATVIMVSCAIIGAETPAKKTEQSECISKRTECIQTYLADPVIQKVIALSIEHGKTSIAMQCHKDATGEDFKQ